MITSVGEYWFLALAFPIIIFIFLSIILRLLSSFALFSNNNETYQQFKKLSPLFYYRRILLRKLLAICTFAIPIFCSYLIFSSGRPIEIIYPQHTGEKYELVQGDGFLFGPTDKNSLFTLFPHVFIGKNIAHFLLETAPDGISMANLSMSLQKFNQSQENQRLIINHSNQTLYIQQHFYTEADIQPMTRRKIPAHVMVAVPYGFFSPLYVGCKDNLPNSYVSDGITLPANSFLLQITEKPSEQC
ncbi:MAG: hypothetical protein Q9M92_10500 [Enterobacterales bacterium]|nr:hypothetical protein [Enterobacterales bacterium]